MEIIAYRGARDIDVAFDDGSLVTNATYQNFSKGQIKAPQDRGENRVGLTGTSKAGQKMTVIVYRKEDDIDVKFEDGVIAEHMKLSHFLRGEIANPSFQYSNQTSKDRVGERSTASCGMGMELVAYRGWNDVDVRFDDGEVVCGRTYRNFKIGAISHPKLKKKSKL